MTHRRAAAILAIAGLVSGCHAGSTSAASSDDVPKGARVLKFDYADGRNVRTLAIGAGIACQADGILGPMTYNANDAGRRGVRRLTPAETKTLREIRHYVKSPTLRYTWLGYEFIVYDAIYGPCIGSVYPVLNGGCNEIYSPTDTFLDHTGAGTGCWGTPPPWNAKKRRHA